MTKKLKKILKYLILAKIANFFLNSSTLIKNEKKLIVSHKRNIFHKNTYSMVKYYLSSIKNVLTQKCKILKNDCLLCYSKTL